MDAHLDWKNNLVIMTNEFQSCAGICGFQGELFSRVHTGSFSEPCHGFGGHEKKIPLTRECLQFRRLLPEAFQSLQNCSKTALLSPYLKYLDTECLL